MLSGQERRNQIRTQLQTTDTPISASKFAKQFGVSRQTVVGDIALMRASGEAVVANFNGYTYEQVSSDQTAKIVCRHTRAQAQQELELIVANGGKLLNTIIDHEIYGEVTGNLNISNMTEVKHFITKLKRTDAHLLSELTDGVHLHTIAYRTDADLAAIKQALQDADILFLG
ncbi:3H domain-containing protein [Agrilactobacillus fermenti]|uniref:transcription repressor NadR n=1 Tax=Agrilactobacillus fermenti TaxID=2586909 RepID=UPI001E511E4F|nr:transcription repressor NadR [Agrilactobacillus fermenti]MCD2256978.1 transcription repressor NadR [Agrilactobacillus fermenti]